MQAPCTDRNQPLSEALGRIYALYESQLANEQLACRKFCSTCCTRNVTVTSAEGKGIIAYLKQTNNTGLLKRAAPVLEQQRYLPRITINGMAAYCLAGLEPPEEQIDPAGSPCPFLEQNACSIYPVRPFACRCLISFVPCRNLGYAEVSEFLLTVNNLFLQIIEHADAGGRFGNLSDMLLFLNRGSDSPVQTLIYNRPAPALMVPPEHRSRAKPIITALQKILPQG